MRLCFFALLLTGCVTHAFAPPLRAVPLESPAVLGIRETAIAAGGSWGVGSQDLGQESVTVRARRGLVRRLEGSLEANAFHYESVRTAAATLRVGAKYCALLDPERCALALTAGSGGGAYDHGGLFGGDVGAIFGWENRYLVPFIGGRIGFALPISPRAVYDGNTCDLQPAPCGAVFNTPKADLILSMSAGLRQPLPFLRAPRISLLVAYGATWMFDGDVDQTIHALGWGAEVAF